MEAGGNFHGSRSNSSRRILVDVMWKQLNIYENRGSRWNYVGIYGSSWKIPRNIFVEAAFGRRNGSFHFHDSENFHVFPWKLPLTSMGLPLYYHVHSKVPVGVEGSCTFHLLSDRHALKGAGERVDQGLVLVGVRTRLMTQSCMPRVCVRCTTAGALRRQKLFHPQKTSASGHTLRSWDDPGRVNASCPQEGGGTWSRLASLPGLCETSRLLLPVCVARAQRGCRLGELFQRFDVHVIPYPIYHFLQSV